MEEPEPGRLPIPIARRLLRSRLSSTSMRIAKLPWMKSGGSRFGRSTRRPSPGLWHRWLSGPEHINALPYPLRTYIHESETRADPAGDVAVIAFLKDSVEALQVGIHELESEK